MKKEPGIFLGDNGQITINPDGEQVEKAFLAIMDFIANDESFQKIDINNGMYALLYVGYDAALALGIQPDKYAELAQKIAQQMFMETDKAKGGGNA